MKQFSAVLNNPAHPKYGAVTIPFPIPDGQYSQILDQLDRMEAGCVLRQDCRVDEVTGSFPVLKQLENTAVNVDELDYLAKRLESFEPGEAAQFQAVAAKQGLHNITDLINLTFCCRQATVITDFSDLEKIGRDHCMNVKGGSMPMEDYEKLDGRAEALKLILNEEGAITPYGVVYDNGMELCQEYDGRHFPAYDYRGSLLTVELALRESPVEDIRRSWLHLPVPERQLERACIRAGADKAYEMEVKLVDSDLPRQIETVLSDDSLDSLNRMCQAIVSLPKTDRTKLAAAVILAEASSASEITEIAKNLDLFDFVPGVKAPEEYGRHMIRESGRFEYDPELDEFYDYEKYGQQRMAQEEGQFTGQGYVSYHGTLAMEELLHRAPAEQMNQGMGGMI